MMALSHNFANDGTKLDQAVLSSKTLENIGRIFRASAEVEDIISLYLCQLANISEAHAVLLLGRASLSNKIETIRRFAKVHGAEEIERFKKTVDDDNLKAAIEFRNTLAHGALLGITEEGRFAFRTLKTLDQDKETLTLEANSYSVEEFEHCATALEKAVPWLESELSVAEIRMRRTQGGLKGAYEGLERTLQPARFASHSSSHLIV